MGKYWKWSESLPNSGTVQRGQRPQYRLYFCQYTSELLKVQPSPPRTLLRFVFTEFSGFSQKPPHRAARSTINFQLIPLSVKNVSDGLLFQMSRTILHNLRLVINLFIAKRHFSVVWSETISKWTVMVHWTVQCNHRLPINHSESVVSWQHPTNHSCIWN